MKRGEKTPESVKRRKQFQRKKMRYMELREELQLAGVIPTEPAGAIRNEQVDPAAQSGGECPALVGEAVRRGWAVPEARKPGLVDEMVKIIDDPEGSDKVKVAAFNALRQADQAQWERDHPQDKQAAGPTVLNVVEVVIGGNDRADVAEAAAVPPE